jgi:hypothetical protein
VRLAGSSHRRDVEVAVFAFLAGAVVVLVPSLTDIFCSGKG